VNTHIQFLAQQNIRTHGFYMY